MSRTNNLAPIAEATSTKVQERKTTGGQKYQYRQIDVSKKEHNRSGELGALNASQQWDSLADANF
jgi:hypothetical protein